VHDSAVPLSGEDKERLLRVAREAIETYLIEGKLGRFAADSDALLEPRPVFVTLRRRKDGKLRGCRGECHARSSIFEAVARMAVASATDDTRFPPVTLEELPEIHIEISALTPMSPIRPEDVVVGRHGLWIVRGFYSGLLLPQVAVRFGWDREQFLENTCVKAGLPEDAWESEDVQLLGFETDTWEEPE
jgi:AmmeMemoRadiSam system protein A